MLAYTPFPLGLGAHALGAIFFGWGLLLAFTSVVVAPRLQRRLGLIPTLTGAIALVALDLLAMGIGVDSNLVLIVAVVIGGGFLGVVNTVLTETVMLVSPFERPVAAAAYSFVRFTGGAIAPFLAGKLAEDVSTGFPFFIGAAAAGASAAVVLLTRRALSRRPDDAPAATGAEQILLVDGAEEVTIGESDRRPADEPFEVVHG